MPAWDPENNLFHEIAGWSKLLSKLELSGTRCGDVEDLWSVARVRAMIEIAVARLYGFSVVELDQIMRDFPQVDREQVPICGEAASSVTRDLIVASGGGWASTMEVREASDRVMVARSSGAVAFVPNQHARAYRRT